MSYGRVDRGVRLALRGDYRLVARDDCGAVRGDTERLPDGPERRAARLRPQSAGRSKTRRRPWRRLTWSRESGRSACQPVRCRRGLVAPLATARRLTHVAYDPTHSLSSTRIASEAPGCPVRANGAEPARWPYPVRPGAHSIPRATPRGCLRASGRRSMGGLSVV